MKGCSDSFPPRSWIRASACPIVVGSSSALIGGHSKRGAPHLHCSGQKIPYVRAPTERRSPSQGFGLHGCTVLWVPDHVGSDRHGHRRVGRQVGVRLHFGRAVEAVGPEVLGLTVHSSCRVVIELAEVWAAISPGSCFLT